MSQKFTDVFLRNLKPHPTGQMDYVDTISPHPTVGGRLGVRVGKRTKTFFVRYSINGKKRRLSIGKYDAISLRQARSIAAEKLGLVFKGNDPQEDRDAIKSEPVFNDLWEQYNLMLDRNDKQLRKAGKKTMSPKSRYDAQKRYARRIQKPLGKKRVVDIKRKDIAALLETIANDKPMEANACHGMLGLLFKRALNLGWVEHSPLYGMSKPSVAIARTRTLDHTEIKKVWKSLSKLPDNPRDVFKLLFLTAQRSGEVMSLKWSDIHDNEWHMSENKSDRPHVVPLSNEVVRILENRADISSEYVFPSYGKTGHYTGSNDASLKIHELSGVDSWTPHDIRRTSRTLLAELRVEEHVSELILNHSLKGIVAVYNQHQYTEEKREALEKLSKELGRVTNGC